MPALGSMALPHSHAPRNVSKPSISTPKGCWPLRHNWRHRAATCRHPARRSATSASQDLSKPTSQSSSPSDSIPQALLDAALSRRRLGLLAAGVSSAALLPASAARAAVAAPPPPVSSDSSQNGLTRLGFEQRISEFTLPNGLHFIVLERPVAPVVSCHTYANVGAFDEVDGKTGLAHLLEHMAFKGSRRIGTKDFRREAPLLDACDEAFYTLREARAVNAGSSAISRLTDQFERVQTAAEELVVPNAYGAMLQQQGAVGLNATTSHDATKYFLSLPSNKLELWFAMEAERFQAPVFRSLYKEKQVVDEERRMRVDNSPSGRFQEQFLLASLGNNYRRPVIGFAEDVAALGRQEVQDFFKQYYGPSNLTISIVGDVTPSRVRSLAEKYFGGWRDSGSPILATSGTQYVNGSSSGAGAGQGDIGRLDESQQDDHLMQGLISGGMMGINGTGWGYDRSGSSGSSGGGVAARRLRQQAAHPWNSTPLPVPPNFDALPPAQRTFRSAAASGPATLLAYYRPSLTCGVGVALEVATELLSGGRTSRMVTELVLPRKVLSASVVAGYPGDKYAGISLVYGVPRPGDSLESLEATLKSSLANMTEGGVNEDELARVKRNSRSTLYNTLTSNSSMASILPMYHALTGSWRGVLTELDAVQALTPQDVQSVAATIFRQENLFTGYILPMKSKS